MHIKTDDTVQVIAGNDRGKQGRVLSIDRATGKLVVEGCNRVYKHVRRSQKNPQGGRLSKEMPLQVSERVVGMQSLRRWSSDWSSCDKRGH